MEGSICDIVFTSNGGRFVPSLHSDRTLLKLAHICYQNDSTSLPWYPGILKPGNLNSSFVLTIPWDSAAWYPPWWEDGHPDGKTMKIQSRRCIFLKKWQNYSFCSSQVKQKHGDTHCSAPFWAGPSLSLGSDKRADAPVPDGFKILSHTHAIVFSVSRVQLP